MHHSNHLAPQISRSTARFCKIIWQWRALGTLAALLMLLSSCASPAVRARQKAVKTLGLAIAHWQEPGMSPATWSVGPAPKLAAALADTRTQENFGSLQVDFANLRAKGSGEVRISSFGSKSRIVFSIHGMRIAHPNNDDAIASQRVEYNAVIVFEGDFKIYETHAGVETLVDHGTQAYDPIGPSDFFGHPKFGIAIVQAGIQIRDGIRMGGMMFLGTLDFHR